MPSVSRAAIVYDTAGTHGAAASSDSFTGPTVAADCNIVIICVGVWEGTGNVAALTSITYGGSAATFLAAQTHTAVQAIRTEMWYKLAPATGAQTVAVTGNANTDQLVTGVMSFKGVAQTSTFNTPGTLDHDQASGTNLDIDSLASAVGEMGVMCGTIQQSDPDTITVAADATSPVSVERYEINRSAGTSAPVGYGYTEDGAVTSINMRVDESAATNAAAVAVSMRALVVTARPVQPIIFQ
jgi:hypothetical protein